MFTDEGVTGWGSSFANDELVRGALHVLEPLYAGENPLEPERVSEKLHANTFWMGRGGSITHAISGIDIAMWDILGKATGQPVKGEAYYLPLARNPYLKKIPGLAVYVGSGSGGGTPPAGALRDAG